MRSRWLPTVFGVLFGFVPAPLIFAGELISDEGDGQDIVAVKTLEIYLEQVEEDARIHREWGGGILLGLGAGSAIGSVLTAVTGTNAEVPTSLGVTAVVLGGIGALIRVSPTDQETLPSQFREMPEDTPERIGHKRLLGESYLTIFGHQAKRNRLMGSTLNIVLGTVLLGWYASENQGFYRTVNPILLYEGAVLGGLGIVGLFVESAEETVLKNYNASAIKAHSQSILTTMRFGVSPIPSGGIASLSFSF